MKFAALAFALLLAASPAHAVQVVKGGNDESPVVKVVGLLSDLEKKIKSDGMGEQQEYDKYACWCEDVLGRKAAAINQAKIDIKHYQTEIYRLKGEIASHGAEIGQLNKDIAENLADVKDATALREKENAAYDTERTESEQCIGALEAAINMLTGAGEQKKKGDFLQTKNLQEAELLSVVPGVREVLTNSIVTDAISNSDIQTVKQFVDRPQDFFGGKKVAMSAAQTAANPFGDYAPKSTMIQGILKGMYDAFVTSLENANAEEADQEKAFREFEANKKSERDGLEKSLETHTKAHADKSASLAENEALQDDTEAQLAADEEYFATTKENCRIKANEWSERSRLRTEELQGIIQAIDVLSDPNSTAIFDKSFKGVEPEPEGDGFLQISARKHGSKVRSQAYAHVRALAKQYRSLNLMSVASALKTSGYFDKIIVEIDEMIVVLRKEQAADIEHRDRCQAAQNKNFNMKADLEADIDKAEKAIERMQGESTALGKQLDGLKEDIKKTNDDMLEQLKLRNKERAQFELSIKDDVDAVALLEQASVFLSRFEKNKGKDYSLQLVQRKGKDEPTYTVDEWKAPETSWKGGDYGGRSSESGGIVSILGMLIEDLQNELKTARAEDAEAEAAYDKSNAELTATRDAQLATQRATLAEKADVEQDITDKGAYVDGKNKDLNGEGNLAEAIKKDCAWVDSHFDTRSNSRKAEIAGLQEAKDYLAACDDGTAVAP